MMEMVEPAEPRKPTLDVGRGRGLERKACVKYLLRAAYLPPTTPHHASPLLPTPHHSSPLLTTPHHHFFVRDMVESLELEVPFVRTADNIADFFTKPLQAKQFHAMRRIIMNE